MKIQQRYGGYYALRWKILERDNFTCQYCGQFAPQAKLEVDHKIPVSEGGTFDEDNLITACFACNHGKSALSIMTLKRSKARPYVNSMLIRSFSYRQDEVLKLVKQSDGITADEVAKTLNIARNNADVTLGRLKRRQLINKQGGIGLKQWGGKWFIC